MAWTVDLIKFSLDRLFKGTLYEVTIPESAYPYASFNYEGEIDIPTKKAICELFPATWYIYFHPNTLHKDRRIYGNT